MVLHTFFFILVSLCTLFSTPLLSLPMDGSDVGLVHSTETPRFVVKLPDSNLLCFSIDCYELFTYSLISTPNFAINAFVNVSVQNGERVMGNSDIGMLVVISDSRVSTGKRTFKSVVDGRSKKARMSGFGEVDMHQGSVCFSLAGGHTNIESEHSAHEKFRVVLDQPRVDVHAVASDGRFFDVFIKDGTGLVERSAHGLIGQFFSPTVHLDSVRHELLLGRGSPVPVKEGRVWDGMEVEEVKGKQCWYPVPNSTVIEGYSYDYIVEHVLSTAFKYSKFS